METSAVLLVCILVTHSVWTVCGRGLEFTIDDQEEVEMEIPVKVDQTPLTCNICKEALTRVRKEAGENASKEDLKSKLLGNACDNVFSKTTCKNFIKENLDKLIERLQTKDDVEKICEDTNACKVTPLSHRIVYPSNEDAQNQ